MRDVKVIEAEISKLQAELEDVKAHESKVKAAVHILENLGWTWTRRYGWKKPSPKSVNHYKEFDKASMTHIKEGDYCMFNKGGRLEGYVLVRKVDGAEVILSYVSAVTGPHIHVSPLKFRAHASSCQVVGTDTVKLAFAGPHFTK